MGQSVYKKNETGLLISETKFQEIPGSKNARLEVLLNIRT